MQKYVYIVIHGVASRFLRFARNIIRSDSQTNDIKISLVITFSVEIAIGMDNSVTGLTIK